MRRPSFPSHLTPCPPRPSLALPCSPLLPAVRSSLGECQRAHREVQARAHTAWLPPSFPPSPFCSLTANPSDRPLVLVPVLCLKARMQTGLSWTYMCYHLMYSDWLVSVRFYCIFIVIKSCSNILSAPSSAHCTEGLQLLLVLEAGRRSGSRAALAAATAA